MKIAVVGAGGSIGQVHADTLMQTGHQIGGYDQASLPPALFPIDVIQQRVNYEWDDPLWQAVVIATPTRLRPGHLSRAVVMNKIIFCEKPLGLAKDAETVRQLVNGHAHRIHVGFNLRFHPAVIDAKEKLQTFRPVKAHFNIKQKSDKPQYLRDGVLDIWMSHEIDLALYFFGPGRCTRCNGDETACELVIAHDSGVHSTIVGDYTTVPEIRGFTIHALDCDDPKIVVDLANNRVARGHYQAELRKWVAIISGAPNAQVAKIPGDLATGQDGLAALAICEEARKLLGAL